MPRRRNNPAIWRDCAPSACRMPTSRLRWTTTNAGEAVEAERGEQHREGGEEGEHTGIEPGPGEWGVQHRIHRGDVHQREVGVHLSRDLTQRGDDFRQWEAGPKQQVSRPPRLLLRRHVDTRPRVEEITVAGIGNHADHGAPLTRVFVACPPNPLADRILPRPYPSGHALTDDHHEGRSRPVGVPEPAPTLDRQAQGLEVVRHHRLVVQIRVGGGLRVGLAFDDEAVVPSSRSRERSGQCRRHTLHTRNRPRALQELLQELTASPSLDGLRIGGEQRDLRDAEPIRLEARLEQLEPVEGADQEQRGHERHDRERDLGGDGAAPCEGSESRCCPPRHPLHPGGAARSRSGKAPARR